MSKAKENKTEKKVETTVATDEAKKSKNIGELLGKDSTKGEKLSGIVRLMGEAEHLRSDAKRQTMLNKVSKVGNVLTKKSDAEIMADEKLVEVAKLIGANMGAIKTNATNEETEISKELEAAYQTLLSYGKKVKFEDISEDFKF